MKETLETTLANLRTALESEDIDRARQLVNDLHPADLAEVIGDLSLQEQTEVLPTLTLDDVAYVFEHLDEDQAAEMAAQLPLQTLASVLVTGTRDAAGFALFLGLAALYLPYLS